MYWRCPIMDVAVRNHRVSSLHAAGAACEATVPGLHSHARRPHGTMAEPSPYAAAPASAQRKARRRFRHLGTSTPGTTPNVLYSCSDGGPPLPCSGHRSTTRGLLLAAHSQSRAFEAPGRPCPAPDHHSGSPRPSPVSRTRLSIRSRRSVVRRPRAGSPAAAFAREMSRDFSEQNPEALAYPSTNDLISAVRHRLRINLPPSPRGPLMVELFTAGCFGRSPGAVNARSSASLRTSSPRRLGLNEVRDPDPPEEDYATARASHCLTISEHDGSEAFNQRLQVCPGRPDSAGSRPPSMPSDRSCGLSRLDLRLRAFTHSSLRRTGQARLLASGSTRLRHRG